MAQGEISRLRSEAGSINYWPMADWVIIRPIDNEAFKKTKLQLTGKGMSESPYSFFKEMPLQGIVVAVGPGWVTDSGNIRPVGVNVGDHVAVATATMVTEFIFNNTFYYALRSSGIYGIYPSYNESRFDSFSMRFLDPANHNKN